MCQAKKAMMEHEDTINGIIAQLVEAGAAEECENHGYTVSTDDDEAVEQVKTELAEEHGKEEADKLVDEAMSQVHWECPGCVKNAQDD